MKVSRVRLSPLAVIALALLLSQCSAPTAERSPTYKGLTLDEWSEIPMRASARLHDGNGTFEIERDVYRAIEALGAFARESDEALERLRHLATDLYEDTREEAASAIIRVAFSKEPNQEPALAVLFGLIEESDARISSAAVGQLMSFLEGEEPRDRLGEERERVLLSRVEELMFDADSYALAIALEAFASLAERSDVHEAAFLAILQRPAASFRCEEAADELSDFARDQVRAEFEALDPALALRAAQLAVELEPLAAEYLDNLAMIYLEVGDPEQALATSRRAMEAASSTENLRESLRERIQNNFERLSGGDTSED